MPRPRRAAMGGIIYHALNRANERATILNTHRDYAAFEAILAEGCEKFSMRLLCYCLMPNHWHLVLWPQRDNDLSKFMGWVSKTHAQRWRAFRETTGEGHLYQGRFRSFPVQDDHHFHLLCRYVEANPLRAELVGRAQDWRWSSLWRRMEGSEKGSPESPRLTDWPVPIPEDWLELVNGPRTAEGADESLRLSFQRGRPFGADVWTQKTAIDLGLQSTLKPRGRPWPEHLKRTRDPYRPRR